MNLDCIASRHGTTPMMLKFIQRVESGHGEHGVNDGTGDGARRVADFAARVADVVVAHEIVHGDQHGGAQPGGEAGGKGECIGRKIERYPSVKMGEAAGDDPEHGDQHSDPERHGDAAHGGNPAVEQHDDQRPHRQAHQVRLKPGSCRARNSSRTARSRYSRRRSPADR